MDTRFDPVEDRIVRLEGALSAQIDSLGHRLEEMLSRELGDLCKEVAAHTRTIVFACIAAVMTSSGVALGSTRL